MTGRRRKQAEAGGIAVDRLRSIVERVERLEEERKALAEDIKVVYAEAKAAGFHVKAVKQIVRDRRADLAAWKDFQAALRQYRAALGMLADAPLGEAALAGASSTLAGAAPRGSA
jgi:uncharacterized protein (UPF0335 family)